MELSSILRGNERIGPDRAALGSDIGFVVVCGMPFDADHPWGESHVAHALAQRYPVLCVDRPVWLHQPGALRSRFPSLRRASPTMSVLTPLALPGSDRPRVQDFSATVSTRLTRSSSRLRCRL